MLILSASLNNKSVLSLRTGSPIAQINGPIINPDNLKIEGFYCSDKFSNNTLVLVSQDIRDVMNNGFVVNDHEVLVEPNDLVRLQNVIKLNFNLIGKQVETLSKEKLGKVSDFATESQSMFIQKIYVSQSLIKSFTGGSLSIDRSQVNEITPKKVIVSDIFAKEKAAATAPLPSSF